MYSCFRELRVSPLSLGSLFWSSDVPLHLHPLGTFLRYFSKWYFNLLMSTYVIKPIKTTTFSYATCILFHLYYHQLIPLKIRALGWDSLSKPRDEIIKLVLIFILFGSLSWIYPGNSQNLKKLDLWRRGCQILNHVTKPSNIQGTNTWPSNINRKQRHANNRGSKQG